MIAQLTTDYIKTRPTKALARFISYTLFEGRPVTTKGRWINPIVFSFLNIILDSKIKFKQVQKPIFILGTGRSGSTILGIVLSMHKDVGYLNEPKAMWHLIHPKEDVIGSYSKDEGVYRLSADDATDEMCNRAKKLFGAYLSSTFSQRLVDKYPELIFRVAYVRRLFPDARFIFLVRNGWDTCHSIDTWSKRLGIQVKGDTHDWWGVNNRKWNFIVDQLVVSDIELNEIYDDIINIEQHLDKAVVEWLVTMREGLRLMETNPEYIHLVHFEELTSKPEATITRLCDFCDLSIDRTFLNYAKNTLHSIPPRNQFKLNPKIAPLFNDTMTRLGYNR